MKRRYRSELYAQRVLAIRDLLPDSCIGADVISGFPGETEAEFEQTLEFVREQGLDYLHVFTYSSRPGTEAALLEQLPLSVRKERTSRLRAMGDRLATLSAERSRGLILPVLFEEGKDAESADVIEGYTPNYLRVSVPRAAARAGEVVSVLLKEVLGPGKLSGECIPSPILAL
jgi:threonylcarbamoyladenosine tRNA methylthiotransferase MtaB